jgi:pimeloyl-ACP methyl ester carboxylesterase
MWLGTVDEMLGQEDRLRALAGLQVRTLVIVGEQDEPFRSDAEDLARVIPGARLAVIADAGHSPQFEAQERWWEALSGFLDEVGPRQVPR